MPRPEKVAAVEEIKTRIESAEAVFLTEYRGLSVPAQQKLRGALREAGAEFKVLKMSLARLAAAELGLDELAEDMLGPTAIAFADQDPVPAAKALKDFAGEHDVFVLKSGLMSGAVLSPEAVIKLAEIEPLDVLLSKIAGAAKAPLFKTATLLSAMLRNSASAFSQLLEKKEAEGPTESAAGGIPEAGEEAEAAGSEEQDSDEADAEAEASDDSDADESADSPDSPESPDSPDSPDSVDSPDEDEADDADSESDDAASEDEAADSEQSDAESESDTETETEAGETEDDSDSDDKE